MWKQRHLISRDTAPRYVLRDDQPYCIKCYEDVFANNCDECDKLIGIDSKVQMH